MTELSFLPMSYREPGRVRAGALIRKKSHSRADSLKSSRGVRVTPLKVSSDCVSSKQGGTADFFVPETFVCLRDFFIFTI